MERNCWKGLSRILQSNLGFWPLACVCLMFGVILGFHSSLPKVTYVLVLTCSILGYFLALRIPSSCYWILLILAGALLAQPIKIHGGMLENYTKVDLCFYVEEVKGSSDEGYKARILSEEGRFYLYSNIPIYPGEVMQVRTELRPVSPARNPGEFCFHTYLKGQGLRGTADLSFDWQVIKRKGSLKSGFYRLLYSMRDRGKTRFSGLDHGSLYSGLVFGTSIDDDLVVPSREAGTSHFLVVSGLHVGYMAKLAGSLPLFGFEKVAIVPFLIFYAFLAGGTPSVWRAVLAYFVAKEFKSRMLDRVAFTLFFMLLFHPSWLFSASFQYSALAVFGISLTENWPIWGPLRISLGASFMVLPLSLLKNRKMNPFGVPLSIVLGPLIAVMMVLSLVYLVLPVGLLRSVLDCLGLLFLRVNEAAARFTFPVSGFNRTEAVLFWALLLFFWHEGRILPQKRLLLRRAGAAVLIVCAYFSAGFLLEAAKPVELYFFQILDGDAALVRLPYGRGVLIDTGSKIDTFDGAERILNPALLSLGVRRVDTVYLTHRHLDHVGGLDNLVFCDKIMIGNELWDQKAALMEKAPVYLAQDVVFPCGTKVKVVDLGRPGQDPNDNSLVQLVEVLGWRILFTADREMDGLEVLRELAIPADVVKVPHHGSPGSLHLDWMKTTKASVAIFTGGKYGRPDPAVVEAWQRLSAETFVTKTGGAVRIRFYPQMMEVSQWQSGAFAPKLKIYRDNKVRLGGIRLWQNLKSRFSFFWEKMNISLKKTQKSLQKALQRSLRSLP